MPVLKKILDWVILKDERGELVDIWYNEDIRPLPPSRRTWTRSTFFTYQASIGIIIAVWSNGSGLLNFGLNAWQVILAIVIGTFCIGIVTMLGSQPGGKWHVGFPVTSRLAWGLWGGPFPVLNRTICDCTWLSIESWFGGMCVKVMLGAIWPSFYTMKNTLPASVPMETNDFVAWLLFMAADLAFIWVRPEKFHWFGVSVSAAALVSSLCILGWFVHQAGGAGVLFHSTEALTDITPASGSVFSWNFMRAISTVISGQATTILGFADWGRYSKRPNDQLLPQSLGIALSMLVTATIGLICASCSATIWPDQGLLWTPTLLLTQIQEHHGSAARAAVFFGVLPFLGSQFMITGSAAGVQGGMDLAGIFPKFINIRRGAYIVSVIGILIQPWRLANTSTKFVTIMGAYSVFLSPLTAIFHCDYWLVRRQRICLSDLYKPSKESVYWYWYGVNWRAIVAFALGVWSFIPGFVHAVTPSNKVSEGWSHLYYIVSCRAGDHILRTPHQLFQPQLSPCLG
ncbi:hypothetical protein CLAIMM_03253 isoform 1 [Cladophialophora immunda]|nr:hypothetical protein CLAIMM_03253 isoform 1 [Cladophialophora immunda]